MNRRKESPRTEFRDRVGDQLLGGLELADDLLRCVPGAFHGRVPGPVWPDEDSHSPWIDCQGPRQVVKAAQVFTSIFLACFWCGEGH